MKKNLLVLRFFSVLLVLISVMGLGQATLPLTRTDWNTTPAGWTDTPLDSYLSTFACSGNNGAKFSNTNDSKIVNFDSAPDKLSFVVKSNGATTSTLTVEESDDNSNYTSVVSLTGANLPTTCTTKGPYQLKTSTRYIRWKFVKGSQNMTMDDVTITKYNPPYSISTTPAAGTYPNITAGGLSISGLSSVTQKGIIWGPTAASISNFVSPSANATTGATNDGSGSSNFSSVLPGIKPGNTVYFRAYATDGTNTALGAVSSYSEPSIGTSLAYWNFGTDAGGFTKNPSPYSLATLPVFNPEEQPAYDPSGSDGLVYNGAARGQAFSWPDAKVNGQGTAGFKLELNTTGYKDLKFRMDYSSETGGNYTLSYSTDNINWTDISTTAPIKTNYKDNNYNWATLFHDLSTIAAFKNNSKIYLKFKPNEVSGGINDILKIDNIEIFGTAIVQTITTGIISGSPFCAGSSVSVPFTFTETSNSGNIFKAQLSDGNGSFSSPVNLTTASINTTAYSGTINTTIPAGTLAGTGYRIRVISSSPAGTGTDNGSNITINASTAITSQPSDQTVNAAATATFTANATGASLGYQWQQSTDNGSTFANISGANTSSYSTTATSAMNGYKFRVVVSGACGSVTSTIATLTVNAGACIDEGFSGGSTAPTGWTFTGISGTYGTTGNFGNSSPSLKFDDTGDMVETSSISPNTAQELSFWLKGQGSTGSSFLVQGYNGTGWVTIDNITNIPTSATTKTYNSSSAVSLPAGMQKFRFTYNKSAGNLAFDDVKVICSANTTVPTIVLGNNGSVNAGTVNRSSANNILSKFKLDISGNAAILNGVDVYLDGSYVAADIAASGIKLWYSQNNDISTATILKAASSGSTGNGEIISLNGLSTFMNSGTSYLWITADISATAILGHTVNAVKLKGSDLHFSSGNATGENFAGGVQTIINSKPTTPGGFTKICTTATTQQLSWSVPDGGADGYLLVVRQSNAPHAVTDIVAQTTGYSLDYSAAPTYGSTMELSRIIYSGTATSATVTGLTVGNTYKFSLYSYNANGATTVYSDVTTVTQKMGVSDVSFPVASGGNGKASVSWQNPSTSCFDEVIAVVTTTQGISYIPSGSNISANSVYAGGSQVVYSGTGNNVNITGLTNGVTYYIELFVRSGSGWSSGVEIPVSPSSVTIFKPGELFFTGYDGQYQGSGSNDEYLVATLVDIQPGTEFSIVNSRYEAGAAAGVRTDKWGGAGNNAGEAPGVAKIKYKGTAVIPAGSVIVLDTNGTDSVFSYYGVITGNIENNRTADFEASLPFGTGTSPNISTSAPDQIFLVQGNFSDDGSIQATEANYILNGTLLHGLSNRLAWVPLANANSGGTADANRTSRLPAQLECFNLYYPSNNTIVGYYKNSALHIGSFRDIIMNINDSNNWVYLSGANGYTLDPAAANSASAGMNFQIDGSAVPPGTWKSSTNTTDGKDWFYCANWENLRVPDKTTDVIIPASTVPAVISTTTGRAAKYKNIAEVHNLSIETGGTLDMTPSNSELVVYGNWNNASGEAAYLEGGTVTFSGSSAQVINQNDHLKPEYFNNFVLNNDFDTSISNDLIAKGYFKINGGKLLSIGTNNFVKVSGNITNGGAINMLSDGNLLQDMDGVSATGNMTAHRDIKLTTARKEYNYLISPVAGQNLKTIFGGSAANVPYALYYNEKTDYFLTSDGSYIQGRALAVKEPVASFTGSGSGANEIGDAVFTGNIVTGAIPYALQYSGTARGSNLVGNPYPSNLDLNKLYADNDGNIESTFKFWDNTVNTIYVQQGPNYQGAAYAIYNALTGSNGTGLPAPGNGQSVIGGLKIPNKIAKVGQGFIVRAKDVNKKLNFSNTQRISNAGSAQFFGRNLQDDKYRLVMRSPTGFETRAAVVYFENGKDGFGNEDSPKFNEASDALYSIVDGYRLLINGKPDFSENDRIPLATSHYATGIYSIGVEDMQGVFQNGQKIFLKDKATNQSFDLTSGQYSFSAEAGISDYRFEIIYKPETTLATSDLSINGDLRVYRSGSNFIVNSDREEISGVRVYDSTNRLIQTVSVHAKNATIEAQNFLPGVYYLQVVRNSGVSVKKILK